MKELSLDALPLNSNAKICKITCNTDLTRRLLDLGLVCRNYYYSYF